MSEFALVDSHHHVWDLTVRDQPWVTSNDLRPLQRSFLAADLLPLAREVGVTATVVVQTVTHPAETPELLALAAEGGLVTGVVGWVDLAVPGAGDALAALRDRPDGRYLKGIRHPALTEPDPGWLARPEVLHGLAAVQAAGLSYDLVVRPDQLPAAITAATALPGLVFVLDHLGNPEAGPRPDRSWAEAIGTLGALPNTVCKLSGILGEPPPAGRAGVAHLVPRYGTVLRAFGPGRLMFGSDWPVCTLSASYAAVLAAARALTAGLSPAERQQVFGGTARRVYRLGSPAA